jgi:dienelactone hydrolase
VKAVLEGRPLAFVPKTVSPETAARIAARTPIVSLDLFRPGLTTAPEAAEIPVEKTGGPILLVSSRADQLWPSTEMGERVLQRVKSKGSAVRAQHLLYDEASHALPDAWLPPAYGGSLGGTAAGTMSAYRDYWPRVVAFLRDALSRPSAPPSR